MFAIDWSELFAINVPVTELVLRATLFYWFMFACFRFVLRREVGAVGIADVLIIVIVADAAQNGMAGEYTTLLEGFIVVGTLILWNVITNWAGFHSRRFEEFAEPPPLLLVRDGKVLEHNLKREWLTHEELLSKLRQHGVETPEEVRWAYMESDGQLSVRKRSSNAPRGARD